MARSEAAAAHGVVAPALSRYALDGRGPRGLVLGFAAGGPAAIERAAERLARAFEEPRYPPPPPNRARPTTPLPT